MASVFEPGEQVARLAAVTTAIARADGLDARMRAALEGLDAGLGFRHSMLLVPEGDERLIMLACRGYPRGGTGAELRFGEGAIGVAAARRVPVSISHVPRGLQLMQAVQVRTETLPRRSIALPGLIDVTSQVAVPSVVAERLAGVLYAEDARPGRFRETDVHCLQIVADVLAPYLAESGEDEAPFGENEAPPSNGPAEIVVHYHDADGSVFFGDEYVIKSLPGRILRKLLREHLSTGRTEFSKKELRLDAELKLPPVRDNLDSRLILLRRRLDERFPFLRIEATARGRFRLVLASRVRLEEHA